MAIEPISQFFTALHKYPGNNKQWWVAKAGADDKDATPPVKSGDFLPLLLDSFYSGNNKAPRGHFILNAFNKDRSAVSGIPGIPAVDNGSRPSTTAFFSGRAWFAGASTVYYSQILTDRTKAGLCFQEADPTSESISDLIASDGGEVPIPEANSINKLVPLANGMIVFAINGVWFISGGSAAFSATGISVDKISNFGTTNPKAIIQVDDMIFWWSEVGIHALQQSSGQFGPIPGKFGNTSISEQTIQSFYNLIPDSCKQSSKGIFDPKNNIIQWLYSDQPDTPRIFNRVLNYDITLQAFYPWSISSNDALPDVVGAFIDTTILSSTVTQGVTASAGPVTDQYGSLVTTDTTTTSLSNRPTNLTYTTQTSPYDVTFSKFDNRNLVDWETKDGEGVSYSSFIETGYELNADAMRRKQACYVTVFFRRTEEDVDGVPSSCKFRAKWDWSNNSVSNKWSSNVEVYRPKSIFQELDETSGFPVVFTKNKVRGSGKSVQFRFELDEGRKNFDILGWSVSYSGNTKP